MQVFSTISLPSLPKTEATLERTQKYVLDNRWVVSWLVGSIGVGSVSFADAIRQFGTSLLAAGCTVGRVACSRLGSRVKVFNRYEEGAGVHLGQTVRHLAGFGIALTVGVVAPSQLLPAMRTVGFQVSGKPEPLSIKRMAAGAICAATIVWAAHLFGVKLLARQAIAALPLPQPLPLASVIQASGFAAVITAAAVWKMTRSGSQEPQDNTGLSSVPEIPDPVPAPNTVTTTLTTQTDEPTIVSQVKPTMAVLGAVISVFVRFACAKDLIALQVSKEMRRIVHLNSWSLHAECIDCAAYWDAVFKPNLGTILSANHKFRFWQDHGKYNDVVGRTPHKATKGNWIWPDETEVTERGKNKVEITRGENITLIASGNEDGDLVRLYPLFAERIFGVYWQSGRFQIWSLEGDRLYNSIDEPRMAITAQNGHILIWGLYPEGYPESYSYPETTGKIRVWSATDRKWKTYMHPGQNIHRVWRGATPLKDGRIVIYDETEVCIWKPDPDNTMMTLPIEGFMESKSNVINGVGSLPNGDVVVGFANWFPGFSGPPTDTVRQHFVTLRDDGTNISKIGEFVTERSALRGLGCYPVALTSSPHGHIIAGFLEGRVGVWDSTGRKLGGASTTKGHRNPVDGFMDGFNIRGIAVEGDDSLTVYFNGNTQQLKFKPHLPKKWGIS